MKWCEPGLNRGSSPSRVPSSEHLSNLDQHWVAWLENEAPWTHAGTFTCKRYSERGLPITEAILMDTARHFLRRVSVKIFGRVAKRERVLPVVAVFGWGTYGDQPHLHFSFVAPPGFDFQRFSDFLRDAAKRTYWIDRVIKIRPYLNSGWLEYQIEHGTANLIVSLLSLPPSTDA
jgi:hypothetical protein